MLCKYFSAILIRIFFRFSLRNVAKRIAHNPSTVRSKTSLRTVAGVWQTGNMWVRLLVKWERDQSVRYLSDNTVAYFRSTGAWCHLIVDRGHSGCPVCYKRLRRMPRNVEVRSSLSRLSISRPQWRVWWHSAELTSALPGGPARPAPACVRRLDLPQTRYNSTGVLIHGALVQLATRLNRSYIGLEVPRRTVRRMHYTRMTSRQTRSAAASIVYPYQSVSQFVFVRSINNSTLRRLFLSKLFLVHIYRQLFFFSTFSKAAGAASSLIVGWLVFCFFTTRRYGSMVCATTALSVRPSVCHTGDLCQNS